jgi:hypothetical protein
MADNESTLADEDGAFPDWIEIYNPSASPVNLLGYFLTDDKNDPTRWAFPDITAPGAYLVVFASGKNRVNPASPCTPASNSTKPANTSRSSGPDRR